MLSLFFCCLQSRDSSDDQTDTGPTERSHLIPAATESAPTSPKVTARAAEYERMRERMGNIVKSKEGKMVNLNARLPFNLHNQKLATRIEGSSSSGFASNHSYSNNNANNASGSSSSRSVSSSAHPSPAVGIGSATGTPHSHGQVHAHVGRPLTSTQPTAASGSGMQTRGLSASSSGASRSRSAHNIENDGPIPEETQEEDRLVQLKSPVHGVRLVRGLPLTGIRTARRGRAKRKSLGGTPLVGDGVPTPDEGPRMGGGGGVDGDAEDVHTPVPHDSLGNGSTPRPGTFVHQQVAQGDRAEQEHPTVSVSPASSLGGFKVQDAGPLTVSWGD